MGIEKNISRDKFPRQGAWLGRQVNVCFDYDTSYTIGGEIVREDAEEPGRMIIKLANGRYVLSTECQYQLLKENEKAQS